MLCYNLIMTEGSNEKRMDRRAFLKKAAIVGAGTAATAVGVKIGLDLTSKKSPHETNDPITDGENIKVDLEPPETPNISGLNWFPDGHSSFIKTEDGVRVFLSGGPNGYMVEGNSLTSLGKTQEIISPGSDEKFDRNYAAPGSVIRGNNPDELLMFYHGEYHPQAPNHFPFNAGIGLATSNDNGKSWQKKGQVLKGLNDQPAVDRVYGAGQPSAIRKDDYIYLYYIDWNGEYPDSIHLARAQVSSNGTPDSWEKFYNGEFKNTGMDGKSTPVIAAPKGDYAALPGVSWNSFLNKFLAVYESLEGFNISTSNDGLTWDNQQRLLNVQTINNNPKTGQKWNSYPTLWSPNKNNDGETDENLILVYSEGIYNQQPHSLRLRPMKLSKV